jgi:hypothetical protein
VGFDAEMRLVAATGLPYQKRHPSRRRLICIAPSLLNVPAYRAV